MLFVSGYPADYPPGWKPLPVYHALPGKPLDVTILSPSLVGAYLHWNEMTNRYYPCLGQACHCAKTPCKRVYKAWAWAFMNSKGLYGLAEFTRAAAVALAVRLPEDGLRGVRVILSRATMRRNSLLQVKVVERESLADHPGESRNIRPDLLYSWGYDPFGSFEWESQP